LEEKGLVQVSMNIVDYDKTAIYRVLEFIRMEAARWGVTINGTEVYGMIPAAALIQSAEYYLQIDDFDPSQVLELKLLELMREED
jgi:glutamate formiminotransferase